MKDKYTHIFEPLTVRTMTIKNRICMMPMGTNYGEQNGEMSFLHIDYNYVTVLVYFTSKMCVSFKNRWVNCTTDRS